MASNIWDVLGKAGEGAVKAAVANQNAQNTLKSQLLLYKIKSQFEKQLKTGERKDKFAMDLALEKEKAAMPFQMYQDWQKGQGNPGAGPAETPYADVFRNDFRNAVNALNKIKTLPLDEGEKSKRRSMVQKRLKDAYPGESAKIDNFFMSDDLEGI
jgi:hypothetical protein